MVDQHPHKSQSNTRTRQTIGKYRELVPMVLGVVLTNVWNDNNPSLNSGNRKHTNEASVTCPERLSNNTRVMSNSCSSER